MRKEGSVLGLVVDDWDGMEVDWVELSFCFLGGGGEIRVEALRG